MMLKKQDKNCLLSYNLSISLSLGLYQRLAFCSEAQGQVQAVFGTQAQLWACVPMWPSLSMWVYPALWGPHAAHWPFDTCTYIFPKWLARMPFGRHCVRRRAITQIRQLHMQICLLIDAYAGVKFSSEYLLKRSVINVTWRNYKLSAHSLQ